MAFLCSLKVLLLKTSKIFILLKKILKANTVFNHVLSFIRMEDLYEYIAAKPSEMWIITVNIIVTIGMKKHGFVSVPVAW